MAGEIQIGGTTFATESGGTVTVSNVDSASNRTNLGLGSIATQAADSVSITGGNITGGTIGSSVVFPAGKVLQVVHTETTETNTLDSTYTNYYEVPLTLKSSSSDVIVTFTFQYLINAVDSGFGVQIYRGDSAAVTTSDTAVWTKNVSNSTGPFTFYSSNSGIYSVSSITGKDTITGKSAGNTIYYGLFARRYNSSSSIIFPANSTENGFFSSLIMEVQK